MTDEMLQDQYEDDLRESWLSARTLIARQAFLDAGATRKMAERLLDGFVLAEARADADVYFPRDAERLTAELSRRLRDEMDQK